MIVNPFCINCNYMFEFGTNNCKCSLGLDSEDRRVKHMIKKQKTFGKQAVAATMYQAFGSIESSAMPEGEWQRCMDWLSATANGVDAGELLPVYSLEGAG